MRPELMKQNCQENQIHQSIRKQPCQLTEAIHNAVLSCSKESLNDVIFTCFTEQNIFLSSLNMLQTSDSFFYNVHTIYYTQSEGCTEPPI